MAQQLTVRHVGGMLPTLRPSKTWAPGDLDPAVRSAATAFVALAGRPKFDIWRTQVVDLP